MTEYCICGHIESQHIMTSYFNIKYCRICYILGMKKPMHDEHPFKLDNLKFIEELAKERNLI